ncbi:hypothetical protein MC885_010798 [Smutsia gigantea]|nr:hypothetical protein MC885_010798 [Smutsia gigantea]
MLRTPKCSRCRNHGFLVPVKGHAGKCRWKQCTCEKCRLITERQKIMAAQKALKEEASKEEQEVSLSAQEPQLPSGAVAAAPGSSHLLPPLVASGDRELGPEGRVAARLPERPPQGPSPGQSTFQPALGGHGCGHLGPSERAAAAVPSSAGPQIRMEAAGRGHPGLPELHGPPRPVPSPPLADLGLPLSMPLDRVVGSEHLERETPRLYPSCSSMRPYYPFWLGYQDAARTPGIPLQQGFRHMSCSHYCGGGLVSEPVGDFQPSYPLPPLSPQRPPPQPQFLPPGFLSALHLLPPPPPPPPPPAYSLRVLSDMEREPADNQDADMPREPNQPSSQEQRD